MLSGEYHRIDTIAYPKNTNLSKSFLKNMKEHAYGLFSAVSGLFGRKEKSSQDEIPESFKPMSQKEMSIFALEKYLLKYKEILSNGSFSEFDIHSVAIDISFVFSSLCIEYVSSIGDSSNHAQAHERRVDYSAIKDVSEQWVHMHDMYLFRTQRTKS